MLLVLLLHEILFQPAFEGLDSVLTFVLLLKELVLLSLDLGFNLSSLHDFLVFLPVAHVSKTALVLLLDHELFLSKLLKQVLFSFQDEGFAKFGLMLFLSHPLVMGQRALALLLSLLNYGIVERGHDLNLVSVFIFTHLDFVISTLGGLVDFALCGLVEAL